MHPGTEGLFFSESFRVVNRENKLDPGSLLL